jgi:predicted enzyme related to lactoylglutathione lyase
MGERSNYPDGEPCWADVVTPDLDAGQRFYNALFSWEYQNSGPEFGNYSMAAVNGKLVAGVTPPPPGSEPGSTPPVWTVYLASADVDATAAKIDKAGGKVIMGPMDVPGSGRFLVAVDPTGATFGVWQAAGHYGAQLTEEPNTPVWAEVHTGDGAAADTFYRSLFDYQQEQIGDGTNFDYTVWSIGDRQVAGRMKEPDSSTPHWLLYFAVDDADAAAQRATGNGGRVLFGPEDSPYGRMATLADPNGAVLGILDPSRRVEG